MGVDVMIVGSAEAIASRPNDELMDWLQDRIEDYTIRYGYIELGDDDVARLRQFPDDEVRAMLLAKVERMKTQGEESPYLIELMISA